VSTPEVSVLIRTHDRPGRLERTVRCALGQLDVDFEVLVIHDGPDAHGYLAALAARIDDPRLRIAALPIHRGPTATRNAGIGITRGDWIAFLDDDDLWSPQKLRKQLDAAAGGAAFVYSSVVSVDDANRVIASFPAPDPSSLFPLILSRCVIPAGGSNVMVHRRALGRFQGFDERFLLLDDWDAWIRLAAAFPAAADPDFSVAYVHHAGNESRGLGSEHREELKRLAEKHRKLVMASGVNVDEVHFARWLIVGERMSGRRWTATASYLRLAARSRSPLDLGRAIRTAAGRLATRHRDVPKVAWLDSVPLAADRG
jgi:glycosyltransferase involved in cell wall biosynthesis